MENSSVSQQFTNKIMPIAAGIRLRLTFGKECKQGVPKTTSNIERTIYDPVEDARRAAEIEHKIAEEAYKNAEKTLRTAEEALKAANEAFNEAKKQIRLPIDNYALNQTEPGDYQKQRLDTVIELLLKYPELKFHIEGHTCDIGTREANERVGFGRDVGANAYLISKGIDKSRILSVECKRDTQPVAPNTSEENRRKNRRVVIVLE